MIYLIQDCYKDNNGYHDILKIGYSDKRFEGSRGKEYNTHNFGYRLLEERPGDKDLETYLHKYFSRYRLSKEWFEYNEEIINTFHDIELPEDEAVSRDEDTSTVLHPKVEYLKTVYRRRIVDPDFLLGTNESIEARIDRSMEIATRFWYYISEHGIEVAEQTIEEEIRKTRSLLEIVDHAQDEKDRQILLEIFARQMGIDMDYIYVLGESIGEYRAVFDDGKYKIEKLALEIFRTETLKI